MFDRPERPLSITSVFLCKIRRVRVEPRADVGFRHSGRQVTADAQGGVAFGTGRDPLGVLDVGRVNRAGAQVDGALAQLLDECQYDPGVVIIGADVVNARADVHHAAERQCRESTRSDKARLRDAGHEVYCTTIVPTMRG